MPIQFSCPSCGKQTVVGDQFAGQTGPCAACGAKVTIPGGAPLPQYGTPPRSSGTGTVLMVVFAAIGIVGLLCAGIMAALLLPAVGAAREAARRTQSMNNLKQIALAVHNYHDTHNAFPPAVVTDANGNPLYSGRVLLLPFMEQEALYSRFDKNKAWDSPENQALSQTALRVFQDPSSSSKNPNRSDYVFVTGKGAIFEAKTKLRLSDVTDGTSNTLLVVETSTGPSSWAEPVDWDSDTGTLPASNRKNLVLVAFADGSVRAIQPQAVQGMVKDLAVRNDGKAVMVP